MLLAVALGVLVVGCGDDGDRGPDALGGGQTRDDRAATAQPPGTDPEAVAPYVDDLLVRYERVVNDIVLDPSVADDPSDPLIEEFLALYVPDSSSAGSRVEAWAVRGRDGVSLRPYSDDHPAVTSFRNGDVETVSEDEVAFPVCLVMRHRYYDGEGRMTEVTRYSEWEGDGTAGRVDGEWYLDRLDPLSGVPSCRDPEGTDDR